MSRFLLDTNIISDATKVSPSPSLVSWMSGQMDADLFISALSLAEIRRGILQKPRGAKRRDLERWYGGPEGPSALFRGRVLPFDAHAADRWAELMADGFALSRPRRALDMILAATALASDCLLVTDNERHFAGVVDYINPLRPG